MAFHIDCAKQHGLVSIETKPASYGAQDWMCDACKRHIPEHHIGVLNCERCRCDICPSCWTVLLPKIVNAAGYPCFWTQTRFFQSAMTLGCRRANIGNFGGHVLHCGVNGNPAAFGQQQAPTPQCVDCARKQAELQAGAVSGADAPGLLLTVVNMNLRVRATASLESPILGVLLIGKQFRFTNFVGSWAKLCPSHYSDLSQSANCIPEEFRPHNPVNSGWCLMKSAQGEVLLADSAYALRASGAVVHSFPSERIAPPLASWFKVPGAPHPPPKQPEVQQAASLEWASPAAGSQPAANPQSATISSFGFRNSFTNAAAGGGAAVHIPAPANLPPLPGVQLSADRVTFTVQSEVSINKGFCSASADASADGAESQWLGKFKAYLSQNNTLLNAGQRRRSGPADTPPAVQALYRSSALPNSLPSMRKQLGSVSNGLVGACLTAFTEVNYACFFTPCCHAVIAAQASAPPPRRHLPSSARCSCHSRVSKW
jgi:hypothetical protein